VYWVLDIAMNRAVATRSTPVPEADEEASRRGLALFRDHCVQCHGAPGVAPQPFALGMTPVPSNLVATAREWDAARVHWVVERGLKMTGMPAWRYRFTAQQLRDVTAFVMRLPELTPMRYRELAAAAPAPAAPADPAQRPGDPQRGREAFRQYGCASCHRVMRISGARQHVGPPLDGLAQRRYLAGMLPNTEENLVRWIRFPQQVDPRSAMPDLGVGPQRARDIAAFLQTLE
jgi:mono/diheme cytochrome c family protein